MIEGKYNLELNLVGDGRVFLNYWDYLHGDDVVAEIVDKKILIDENEVSFDEFIERVKETVSKYKKNA